MAASYEARRFGVHSALPLATAHRRCPQMVLVPSDHAHYRAASRPVMEILRRYSDAVEVAGLDEAYLDLSGSPAPKARARKLKAEVRAETGLVCSVGIGPNKLVAKIASDLDKPDGFCVLSSEQMLEAVGDRPASLIPGDRAEDLRAPAAGRDPHRRRAGRAPTPRRCEPRSGRGGGGPAAAGARHRRAARWRPVGGASPRAARRPSRTDVSDYRALHETLDRLADSVCKGLAKEGISGRHVTVKLRLAPFRTRTRSQTLAQATRDAELVAGARARAARTASTSTRRCGWSGSGSAPWSANRTQPVDDTASELALPI